MEKPTRTPEEEKAYWLERERADVERYRKEPPTIHEAQHYVYFAHRKGSIFPMFAEILSPCRERYLASAALLEVENELVTALETISSSDHRTLQDVYWLIAREYDRAHNGDQLYLQLDPSVDPWLDVAEKWLSYFRSKVHELSKLNWFCRNVCIAACFPNPDSRGIEAESELYTRLKELQEP